MKIKTFIHNILKFGLITTLKQRKLNKKRPKLSLKDIQSFHMVDDTVLSSQRNIKFKEGILFSIITPLYNTPKEYLEELIESVKKQTYENWELCFADGSDFSHNYVEDICKKCISEDKRIKYIKLTENKGISENTNECIKIAKGNYYVLLDHDDLLHPSALFEAAKVIEEKNADFIYTDEAKFSKKPELIDNIYNFNFKSGFGIDELRSHNYICHLTIFNKSLIQNEKVIYRKEFDGSQDHDMVLRLTEKAKCIVHIPKVLYYWRVHENSVSKNINVKSYCIDSAIKAVTEQLIRNNENGIVYSSFPFKTLYKIDYKYDPKVNITIILHHCENRNILEKNIKELRKIGDFEIIYLYSEPISSLGGINFISNNINFSDQINQAVKQSSNEFILLLECGCVPKNLDCIYQLLMHVQRKNIGSVSGKVINKDNTVYYAGIALDFSKNDCIYRFGELSTTMDYGYEAMLSYVRNTTIQSDTCLMFKKELFNIMNGFNDINGYECIDFSLRLFKEGYRNVWTPYAMFSKINKNNDYSYNSSEFYGFWNGMKEEYLNDSIKKIHLV